jgi:Subtilase family
MRIRVLYAFIAAAVAAASVHISAQTASTDPSLKLTTVLQTLAGAVPQDDARAVAQGRTSGTRVSVDALPKPVQDAMAARRLRLNDAGDVQVYVLMSAVSDERLEQLRATGATIEIADSARRRVQARIPQSRLQAVASLAFVDFIRLPTYARHHAGLTTTEGDKILHADAARQQLSLDGTGVRIGVISDGIKGVFAKSCTGCGGVAGGPIASGDLPDAVGVRNAAGVLLSASGGITGRSFQQNGDLEGLPPAFPICGFAGAGAEGTALLEIVHDIAPGAALSFANIDTDLSFVQAVNYLASTNDIVVDDLGFFGDAYDGTSVVSSGTATALNNPAYPIRGYFTSVGNSADEHYYGLYQDSHVDATSVAAIGAAGHVHLFQQTDDTTDLLGLGAQPYNIIALPRGGEVAIFLSWDDPMGGSVNNYDLFLVDRTTSRVVASSRDVQRGAQDPQEFIDFVNTGASGYFEILVQNVGDAAQPKHLNLFSFQPECAFDGPRTLAAGRHERHNYNTATFSVSAQSDSGGSPVAVVSVGAICSASAAASAVFASNPNASCNDTTNSTAEFFSSRGPTLDGRTKPDVSAIDGVSVSGAGQFETTFFGTSAAAPHAAAIAALTAQAAPCVLAASAHPLEPAAARTALRDLVVKSAIPLNESGTPDNVTGAGRVDAAAAVRRTLPTFAGPTTIVVDANSASGATLTAAQLGFTDPSACAVTTLAWTGGCGTGPGQTLTCPRGTSAISVSASNNGVSFSAAIDLQVVVR